MSADLKTATSAVPGVHFAGQLATTETALYTIPAGAAFIGTLTLTNVTASTATAMVSKVKSGGTGGATNRVRVPTLAAGESLDIDVKLGEGDFLSAQAGTATAITAVLDGTLFSNSTGAALSGIQDDAVGSGGFSTSTPVTGTNPVGTGSNRYLIAALVICHASGAAASSTFTTLNMTCADGAMTKLVSAEFGNIGSVHLFGRANPSNTLHTLTANVAQSGIVIDHLMLASMSLSGVASVTGAQSADKSSGAVMSLAVTSALTHRVVFAAGMQDMPRSLNRRYRRFDGNGNSGTPAGSAARYLLMADDVGSGSVAIASANSLPHSVVGVDLVPA